MSENCPQENKKDFKYEVNPFISEMISGLKETTRTKREFAMGDKSVANIVVNSEGEITGETALMRFKKVDTEQFTKLYCTKIKNFFTMPTSANLMFEYIILNLKKDQDQIYLYESDLVKHSRISSRSCKRGIEWLIENSILAKTVRPYWFFINPTLFFNGDRLTLIDVYQKENAALEMKSLQENQKFLGPSTP